MTSAPIVFLRRLWSRIAFRRADLLGREQGQTIVRVTVIATVIGYFLIRHAPFDPTQPLPFWLVYVAGYVVFSLAVAVSALRATRSSGVRRVVANVADVTAVAYLMSSTGEISAPLFVLFLWVTLGNGFRFGLAAMGISAVLSVAGFAVVIATSEFWQAHQSLAAGILVALFVLPAYAAHLIRQLHRARERAEQANAAKSQFLARMSHELRTPLNGVLGTTELLHNNPRMTSADRDLLGVIRDSVSVSLRQIDSVLDFARIEAGKLILEKSEFDLHRLMHATVRMISAAAREKNLRLLVRLAPQTPYRLIGDPHHLREILLNLLSNAIKFTRSGYVAIQVEPIFTADDSVQLRFEIRDTGIGIATEALGRIWERFAQEDNGTSRHFGGTGLGTTIAKQLVELMNGRIAVSSIKGRGAVFWCDLPFRRPAEPDQTGTSISGARLLVLTADNDLVQHLRHELGSSAGSILAIANVADAIAALGRSIRLNNPWHLVLVDEQLALAPGNRHRTDELTDKALIAQAPLYLVTDAVHDVEQLCEWGYAGVLARRAPAGLIKNCIHASPHFEARSEDHAAVVRVEPWAWGRESKTPARILVADDNRINRLILEQMLESAGYQAEVVDDGQTALQRLTTGRHKAAILDLHMPGLDGDDLLRRYRLIKGAARIPIIMLTADITFDAKRNCADAGADAFLTKPVTSEVLLSTLERLIHERQVRNLPPQTPDINNAPVEFDIPTLDVSVLAELDRLCREPSRFLAVIETFENEGEVLLAQMAAAVVERNFPAFTQSVRALQGNAMNIGAMQLVAACQQSEVAGVLDFRLHGQVRVREIGEQLVAARRALRALCPPISQSGHTGPP